MQLIIIHQSNHKLLTYLSQIKMKQLVPSAGL